MRKIKQSKKIRQVRIRRRENVGNELPLFPENDFSTGQKAPVALVSWIRNETVIIKKALPAKNRKNGSKFPTFDPKGIPVFMQVVKKIIIITSLIVINFSGISVIGKTGAFFGDIDKLSGNSIDAGTIAFELVSPQNFIPDVKPNVDSSRSIGVNKTGENNFVYNVKVENPQGDLCAALELKDDLNNSPVPLIGFLSADTTFIDKSSWLFTAHLENIDNNLIGKSCGFDLRFDGWQIGFASGVYGFSDTNIINNMIIYGVADLGGGGGGNGGNDEDEEEDDDGNNECFNKEGNDDKGECCDVEGGDEENNENENVENNGDKIVINGKNHDEGGDDEDESGDDGNQDDKDCNGEDDGNEDGGNGHNGNNNDENGNGGGGNNGNENGENGNNELKDNNENEQGDDNDGGGNLSEPGVMNMTAPANGNLINANSDLNSENDVSSEDDSSNGNDDSEVKTNADAGDAADSGSIPESNDSSTGPDSNALLESNIPNPIDLPANDAIDANMVNSSDVSGDNLSSAQ
jgi:hypothetical protein